MTEEDRNLEPLLESAWSIHSYINEYIRFGDAKAFVVIAWCSSLIAGLYSVNAHRLVIDQWGNFTRVSGLQAFGAILAFLILAAGFASAVFAIRPNLGTSHKNGVIFWQTIKKYKTPTAYSEHLRKLTDSDLHDEIAKHIFDISEIATRKYWWVNLSIWIAAAGSAVALAVAIGLVSPK